MTTIHDHPAAQAPTEPPDPHAHRTRTSWDVLVHAAIPRPGDAAVAAATLSIRSDLQRLRWGVWTRQTQRWEYHEQDIPQVFDRHLQRLLAQHAEAVAEGAPAETASPETASPETA